MKLSKARKGKIPWNKGKIFPKGIYKHTEEIKEKIRISKIGKKLSQEHIEKLRKSHIGKPSPNKGKKFSEQHKINLSLAHLGKNSNNSHYRWKGGKVTRNGYVYILSPYHPSAKKDRYIKRARLIMEKHIGRFLTPYEIVHHINKIKNDDRIKNLQIVTRSEHNQIHNNLLNHGVSANAIPRQVVPESVLISK